MDITTEQYISAIRNALSERQIEILKFLFDFPFSRATAKELAQLLSPENPNPIVASGQIGKIGKSISTFLSIVPEIYFNGHDDVPAYFLLIGPYDEKNGWQMNPNLKEAFLQFNTFVPAENVTQKTYIEGIPTQVTLTKHERNPTARKKCIEYFGLSCVLCGFNFEKTYGEIGKDFIHIHHLLQISTIGIAYEIDPIKDLRPVCPNCHSIIHKHKTAHTMDEMVELLKQNNKG